MFCSGPPAPAPSRPGARRQPVSPRAGLDLHAEMLRLCARIGFSPPRS
ncbi:hypothetical protein [Acidiphilium sp. 20-67-58]|nr:hypothetical protein [Acidiphilium sp. 20-67-58]